jgi:Uma2 family endonuclease
MSIATTYPTPGAGATKSTADAGKLYEIIDGLKKGKHVGAYQLGLASVLAGFLHAYVVGKRLGLVVTEMLFRLSAARSRRPDIAYVSYDRWGGPTVPKTEAWNIAPNLAVEVVSPTNTADEIHDKIGEYFRAGVLSVWVVYSDGPEIHLYSSPKQVRIFGAGDELTGDRALPRFRLRVSALVEALTKPKRTRRS